MNIYCYYVCCMPGIACMSDVRICDISMEVILINTISGVNIGSVWSDVCKLSFNFDKQHLPSVFCLQKKCK